MNKATSLIGTIKKTFGYLLSKQLNLVGIRWIGYENKNMIKGNK